MTVIVRSPLAAAVRLSETAALEALTPEPGVALVHLNVGEPDFGVPVVAEKAVEEAVRSGFTGYSSPSGLPSLRAAISDRMETDHRLAYRDEDIIVTAGAKQAILLALQALCGPGDPVLIPTPHWVSFPEQVRIAGGRPVTIEPAGRRLGASDIAEAARSSGARGLILNSPANPNGIVLTQDELLSIAEVCRRQNLWVISDEVYSAFVFPPAEHRSIATVEGMRDRTIVVGSMSKTYSMAGWRVGWAAGPPETIASMVALQSHSTSHPSYLAQRGAEAATRASQSSVQAHRQDYANRARAMFAQLNRFPGFETAMPEGGFFCWVDVSGWLSGRGLSSARELVAFLVKRTGVLVVDGGGFGSDRHIRVSFCAAPSAVEDGLVLIGDGLERE